MLIKPKGPRACEGLSKTVQCTGMAKTWGHSALGWKSFCRGCLAVAVARRRLLGALLPLLCHLGCDTPGWWLEGKGAERPVCDFAPHVSERGRCFRARSFTLTFYKINFHSVMVFHTFAF